MLHVVATATAMISAHFRMTAPRPRPMSSRLGSVETSLSMNFWSLAEPRRVRVPIKFSSWVQAKYKISKLRPSIGNSRFARLICRPGCWLYYIQELILIQSLIPTLGNPFRFIWKENLRLKEVLQKACYLWDERSGTEAKGSQSVSSKSEEPEQLEGHLIWSSHLKSSK